MIISRLSVDISDKIILIDRILACFEAENFWVEWSPFWPENIDF